MCAKGGSRSTSSGSKVTWFLLTLLAGCERSQVAHDAEPTVMHQGFTFDLDTHQFKRFELEPGTEAESTFPFSSTQETIPSFHDGVAIRRWSFSPGQRNTILSVSTTPLRGTGSEADPLVFSQTVRTVGGIIGTGLPTM